MGDIVPFIARVRDTGDWSPGERARLEEFGERLAASGARIEVIFGTTDEGDPWCVVKDHNEDVLVHVARIDGRFVVYSAIEDAVAEDTDLHEALRHRLADAVEIPTGQVLPFALPREAQTFVALLVATAFFYETGALDSAFDPPAPPAELEAQPDPDQPSATADRDEVHERNVVTQGALFAESILPNAVSRELLAMAPVNLGNELPPPLSPKDLPQVTPLETTTRQPAAVMLARSEAQTAVERLNGEPMGERIVGTSGADTLRGATLDTLEGGAGDDRLVLAGATAIGGPGADIFVISAPAIMGRPDTLLGVIEDFATGEDRVTNPDGVDISLMPPTLGPPGTSGTDKGTPTTTPAPYTRIEVDVDGDGTIDGYILVRPRTPTPTEGGSQGRPGSLDGHVSDVDAGVGRGLIGEDAWA